MNKIAVLILLLFIPAVGFTNPQITPLNQNQKAPFSGVLYNSEAVAEMIAWKETLVQQHQLALDELKQVLEAQSNLQVSNLQAEIDSCNDRYNEMLGVKNQQIIKLEELALEGNNSPWWFAGGIVTGALITLGVVYAIN